MKIQKITSMKGREKITVLTAYGYAFAAILANCKIDIILVGDSLGNVVLGYETTKKVTMDDMLRHTKAVRRGALHSLIVADMPYASDETPVTALKNAKLLLEAGADAVKVEGKPDIVEFLTDHKMPVMGHIGYLPQTDGKPAVHKELEPLVQQARALEKAGAFAVVLEMVQTDVAKEITKKINIPTIGIGAGPYCDGQVLVINDMLGLFDKFHPKFVKRYAELGKQAEKAVKQYISEVKQGKFPDKEHSFNDTQ